MSCHRARLVLISLRKKNKVSLAMISRTYRNVCANVLLVDTHDLTKTAMSSLIYLIVRLLNWHYDAGLHKCLDCFKSNLAIICVLALSASSCKVNIFGMYSMCINLFPQWWPLIGLLKYTTYRRPIFS